MMSRMKYFFVIKRKRASCLLVERSSKIHFFLRSSFSFPLTTRFLCDFNSSFSFAAIMRRMQPRNCSVKQKSKSSRRLRCASVALMSSLTFSSSLHSRRVNWRTRERVPAQPYHDTDTDFDYSLPCYYCGGCFSALGCRQNSLLKGASNTSFCW